MSRAFAKVILLGEHAVVHGKLALAGALDRGATARATRVGAPGSLRLLPWGRVARPGEQDEVARAFRAVVDAVLGPDAHVDAEVETEVPGGAGLGCSAAIAVALARAVAAADGRTLDDDSAAAAGNAWEKVFHGNPSGIDAAVAARGGVLAFRRGEPPRRVSVREPLALAVAYTGEAASTRQMVSQVARQLERRPQVVERTLDGIDTLSLKAVGAIEDGRLHELGRLMDLNHALLAGLLVSTERLELACNTARAAGALGAKLTGGGGGGSAIALAPGRVEHVLEAWRGVGIEGFAATLTGSPA